MQNKWYFAYNNAPLPEALQNKLNKYGILKAVPETNIPGSTSTSFIKDFFTPDGYPPLAVGMKHSDASYPYLFPAIAPWYTAAAVPAIIADMEPLYRQTACEAALSWLFNLTAAADPSGVVANSQKTFNGLAFQEEINGTVHTFAFPDTCINTKAHGRAAVILIADSYWNNNEWEKQGSTPLYARQQAMFQLWCWNKFAEKSGYQVEAPATAFVVRICGNLAVDCTIRTVTYNPKEAQSLISRICKARDLEPQKGLYWKRTIEAPQTWAEKLENEAFYTDNEDLHDLVIAYMKARSDRKVIERELKEITDKMEGIAVKLASMIPAGDIQGNLELPDGSLCTVTHQPRRASQRRISPDLVRSFFPALDDCISSGGSERVTVTISAL